MACRLFSAKPLSKPMLVYCQLDRGNKFQWNLNRNSNIFTQENASEYVCKMAAMLLGLDMLKCQASVSHTIWQPHELSESHFRWKKKRPGEILIWTLPSTLPFQHLKMQKKKFFIQPTSWDKWCDSQTLYIYHCLHCETKHLFCWETH